MKVFARPYWILLTVTLPQSLIILYYLGIHGVVSSLLEPKHLEYWIRYGAALSGLIVAATAYAAFLQIRRRSIPWTYALVTLPAYLVFLYAYFEGVDQLLPFSVPQWMIPLDEALILPIGLIMPVLMHSLLLLVDRATPAAEKHSLIKTTVGAVAIPAFWYVVIRFVFPLLRGDWEIHRHILEVMFIILTVAFMFLLMRLTYLLILKISRSKFRHTWLLRLPFTTLLPLLALLVYNRVIGAMGKDWMPDLQLIGDWSHPAYYALAFINGVLLTLPPARQAMVRLGSFATKALFYPFTVYFFIVFLPFFPVAIDAVVFLGLGFLLLAPLILFFFHTRSLYDDWRALGERFGRKMPMLVFLSAFAVVPVGLTITYGMDRSTLNTMLAHVYEPDYASADAPRLDLDSARRVLDTIKTGKEGSGFLSSNRKPYLTTYYQWLVLDNLTLSSSRLNDLERIFLDSPAPKEKTAASSRRNDVTKLAKVATSTKPADDGKSLISQVDLTISHRGSTTEEYVTRFSLPPGAWVQDYYLVIDGKKVAGILAERKSALWLYQQIRDTQRDPGIIYYTSPDELMLRVFPFAPGESRQTGFTIIHREPLTLEIDGTRIDLRAKQTLPPTQRQDSAAENFVIVSAAEKSALPKHQRKPYLHFIIDRSAHAAQRFDAYRERVDKIVAGRQLRGVDMTGAMITVANYADQTFPLDKDWPAKAQRLAPAGGLFLERAVKRALYANYRQRSDSYPVFVVISDHIEQAVSTEGMHDFELAMPEGDLFFVAGEQGITARRLSAPMASVKSIASPASRHVLAWPDDSKPTAFLPDDGRASLVIRDVAGDYSGLKLDASSWENGLKLYGTWMSSKLDPRDAGQKSHTVITNSFTTHLLTPLTAFISPENDAQRQVLLRKQEQMLSSMRPLDAGEEHEMDEPPLWVLSLLLAALLLVARYTRRHE